MPIPQRTKRIIRELDLRKQFDELVSGKNGRIPHKYKVLIRNLRQNSSGKNIECPCMDVLTGEPDQENECRFCLGEGYIWDERFSSCYSSMVGADGGKANRNKRIIPGELRTDYKVFYLRYDENILYNDKIIELSLDLEGKVIIPYKREKIYRPETIQEYRADYGRLEYIAVYCKEAPSIRIS
jgi:hypothetical protein